MESDFGSQGGDLHHGVKLDLSTCLNGYGPAPAALTALSSVEPEIIFRHPYKAAVAIEELYSSRFGRPVSEFVAIRGASEGILQLARLINHSSICLPLPTYTEFRKWFPTANTISNSEFHHTTEQISKACKGYSFVLISNPQNPTGRYMENEEIVAIAQGNPETTLVIDDSYGEFIDSNLIGVAEQNIVVIKSPTKFFGIGGIRVGIIWSCNCELLDGFRSLRSNWPVSMLDYEIAKAAMNDHGWQNSVREQLTQDGVWLEETLQRLDAISPVNGPLHFRLLTGSVVELHKKLSGSGIATRLLTRSHGFSEPALRVTAPTLDRRSELAEALFS